MMCGTKQVMGKKKESTNDLVDEVMMTRSIKGQECERK